MLDGQFAGCFLIHEPRQGTGPWPNDLSGECIRLKRPFKHGTERLGFCVATDEKGDLPGAIKKNGGQGDPGRLRSFHPSGGDQPARFMNSSGAREQGGGMTVRSHAQQDEIEARDFRFGDVELLAQRGFIPVGNRLNVREFARYAMNLLDGNGQMAKEGFMGHSIITVRVIWRDVAFVSPKKPDLRPVKLPVEGWGGKPRIEVFRG